MPVLEAQGLTHVFPDGTIAIDDISLKIGGGEFVIVAGANGSGKTVFIRHLNGLLIPTKGRVLIDGVPINKDIAAARRKIGLIFQDSDSQIVGQTVAEDVAFGPENLNLPRSEVERIVSHSLDAVGLGQHAAQSPHSLSGGQKRKLAIAGVLAMNPDVIMFDEPFTGLDFPGVRQVLKQIVRLHKAGHTIVLVTHELEKALAHADRLVIIHKGKLAE
ncbi:MAG: energy-coupling factor ABC transporter ATP-binding protein, partial [Clostridiales Family XIII bacterium]|nr:energy-coupling factor ABC transporter ATP-binding protein [Clostridiales Family XIII bacterium]